MSRGLASAVGASAFEREILQNPSIVEAMIRVIAAIDVNLVFDILHSLRRLSHLLRKHTLKTCEKQLNITNIKNSS